MEYGAKLELQQESNKSNKVSAGQDSDNAAATDHENGADIRHQVIYVKGDMGKVSIGQTDGAANGTAETDLSGTDVVAYSGANEYLLSSIGYVNSDGSDAGLTVGDETGQFDGLGRHDVVRYDSPALGPVRLALSLGNGDSTEVAARYAAEIGDGNRLAASLGWADAGDYKNSVDAKYDEHNTTSLSVSFLAAGGFNATVSYSALSTDHDNGTTTVVDDVSADKTYTYVKAGYKFGQHAVSADYGVRDNDTTEDNKPTSTSVAYVYKPAAPVDLYASYRVESADKSGVDDVSALIVGGRVKF